MNDVVCIFVHKMWAKSIEHKHTYTHPGRRTTKHILPQDPVCLGNTCDKGSDVDDGVTGDKVTEPATDNLGEYEISSDVRRAVDRRDLAASILAETIHDDDGIFSLLICVCTLVVYSLNTDLHCCENESATKQ